MSGGTITLGGNLSTIGTFDLAVNLLGNTDLVMPNSGTLDLLAVPSMGANGQVLTTNGTTAAFQTPEWNAGIVTAVGPSLVISSGTLLETGVLTALSLTTSAFFLAWFAGSTSYANDAAAAAGGVLLNQAYRNGSVLQFRAA
jgi:hypothetical protein